MKSILGTGPLGIAVMKALLESNPNEQITMVNRSGMIGMELPGNVRIVAADVTDKNIMENIASRSEVIFSCLDVPYTKMSRFYPAKAFALADAMRQTAAKLVFADHLCSYGITLEKSINYRLQHRAQTKKCIMRASVIDILFKSDGDFHDRVAIVKAANVIGPGIRNGIFGIGFMDKLYKGKTVVFFGNINAPHSFTFLNDLARALVNVGTATDTFGEIWHVPNAPAMSIDKWIHLFEVNTNRKLKLIAVPKILVRLAGICSFQITNFNELAYQFDYPYHLDHSKYAGRFGDHITYPSSIVKQTVQWYKPKNR